MSQYDIVIIGGGPGGYVAAIRAAQLGKKVAVVEQRKELGGTCLNIGCIPSKALLDLSEHYVVAKTRFKTFGINGAESLTVDPEKINAYKNSVVKKTVKGIEFLFKKNGIVHIQGRGTIEQAGLVAVDGERPEQVRAETIVLATGSVPAELSSIPIDGSLIQTSDQALDILSIPETFLVVGGGAIGLELGSVYARLGSRVTVVELTETLIPTMDREIAKSLGRILTKQGLSILCSTKVASVRLTDGKVDCVLIDEQGSEKTLRFDRVLVAVGRRPRTENLGIEKVGITLDQKGRIPVDRHFQTSARGIYAIGDAIGGMMLAHKAEEEGVALAEIIGGGFGEVNYRVIPQVVYTWPEVAAVGMSEEDCLGQNRTFKKGAFPFIASGRAKAAGESEGMVKVLADSSSDEILGVHIIGPRAADLIAEAVVAMEYRASAEDIGRIVHAHPTYSEALKEAALAAWEGMAIHL